jgi:hypothetical protein
VDGWSQTNSKDDVEKRKNAKEKSPKSRCTKVDAEAKVCLIMVCIVYPTTQGRYLYPEDNPTPSRL